MCVVLEHDCAMSLVLGGVDKSCLSADPEATVIAATEALVALLGATLPAMPEEPAKAPEKSVSSDLR